MSIKPSQRPSVSQAGSTYRSEEKKPLAPARSLSLTDQIEMRNEEGEKKEGCCLARCFTWIYNLFAALFRRLCCKTEQQREEDSPSTEGPRSSEVVGLPTQPQLEVEARAVISPSLILVPNNPSRLLKTSIDVDMLPAQKASTFCKKFAEDIFNETTRDTFIAFGKSAPGKRVQLWILYRLAAAVKTQPSYEQLLRSYLIFTEELKDVLHEQLGYGPLDVPFVQLIPFLSEQLGIEKLKPQVEVSFRRRPQTEKPVENALDFISSYLKEPSSTALLDRFKSYPPMTQLCILYPLMNDPKHNALFGYLSDALSEFVTKERCIATDQETAELRETFKEIITTFLPTAIDKLESSIE